MIRKVANIILAYLYARCSTDKQELSIAQQVAAARKWLGELGILVRVFSDEACSGSDLKRPGLEALLRACEEGKDGVTHVLVWDSSRLARPMDRLDGVNIVRRIQDAGMTVVYLSSGHVADRSLASDLLSVVEFEANGEYIRKASLATSRGILERVERGFDPGRPVPYGYDKAIVGADGKTVVAVVRTLDSGEKEVRDGKGNVTKKLPAREKHAKQDSEFSTLVKGAPERVAVVREMFRRYAAGASLLTICDSLNARGVPGPRGGTWSKGTVRAILLNEVYAGRLVYNRRTESKFFKQTKDGPEARPKGQEKREVRPSEDVRIVENAFPALVETATFEAVQQLFGRRKGQQPHRAARTKYALSGMLKCGHCGHAITGQVTVSTKGYRSGYYICAGQHNRGSEAVGHTRYFVPMDWLDRIVLETIAAAYKELPASQAALEKVILRGLEAEQKREATDDRPSLARRKTALEKEIANLAANLTKMDAAVAESLGLYAKAAELAAQKAEIERLLAATPRDPQTEDIKRLAQAYAAKRRDFEALLTKAAPDLLRTSLKEYVHGGVVRENGREVLLDLVSPVFSPMVAGAGCQPYQRRRKWPEPLS